MAIGLAAAILGGAAPMPGSSQSHAFDPVIACRSIAEPAARLACFDKSVADFQVATDKRDVVIVDRAEVREARHSLFGFNLPTLRIFGGGDNKQGSAPVDEEEKEINATVRSARMNGDLTWTIVLDSGAVWQQTDQAALPLPPRAGDAVDIRRAALGSYIMKVGRQPGFKARRIG
ncbi:hypothetical protein HZF05_01240 [Sphingomonas sp. CGMCC 1.13654]|uniref:Uncharacterized protein n=1 Tax=Sphingomonas chungangi TaxID=2683589 RepID=A0A838L4Z4_9SPHN|nr:hypothetical protein [Sphingomonas chungangi]MBA2932708.1 hypothetical protein [Sphingomonas chungangi]MVW56330.1 hypothetical protein [Sphingomonas chungangi]